MSRLGNQKLEIPDGVELTKKDGLVAVKGPKGTLEVRIPSGIELEIQEKSIAVQKNTATSNDIWGTVWAKIRNALQGVSKGFEKKLEVNGVGYRAQVQGKKIVLNLGYSHQIELQAPEGIEFNVEENIITISGFDKELVGQIASEIRDKKKPEPYKGKGIKYDSEHIRRKAGKKAATTE